jgi:hypothetical protein
MQGGTTVANRCTASDNHETLGFCFVSIQPHSLHRLERPSLQARSLSQILPAAKSAEVMFETAFIRQPLFEKFIRHQLLCYTNKITSLLESPFTPFLLLQVNRFFAGQLPSKLDISYLKVGLK